jgi:hypothetical protein
MLDNRVFVPVDLSRYEEEFKLLWFLQQN